VNELFRFPRTPHLAWLGPGSPRDDKLLAPDEVDEMLAGEVVVEEKIDGANLGLSAGAEAGEIQAQNRGTILDFDHLHPQFRPLRQWLAMRRFQLHDALGPDLTIFGEWCYATHSIVYTRLPDWFVLFDVFDRTSRRFWSVDRRNALARALGLAVVPEVARGRFDLNGIIGLLGPSAFTDGPAEGVYVRSEAEGWLVRRAKLVRAEFTQAIGEHWSAGPLRTNALASGLPR
jgi:hypothetical protein